jgi:hypothetical protein
MSSLYIHCIFIVYSFSSYNIVIHCSPFCIHCIHCFDWSVSQMESERGSVTGAAGREGEGASDVGRGMGEATGGSEGFRR